MAAKLTRITQKIAIQLHLEAESCTIFSSRSRRPVLKLFDTPSYIVIVRGGQTDYSEKMQGVMKVMKYEISRQQQFKKQQHRNRSE
jgi:hypothetical protein